MIQVMMVRVRSIRTGREEKDRIRNFVQLMGMRNFMWLMAALLSCS